MKINRVGMRSLGVGLLGLLLTITQQVRAIEGLQISLQCSNVVLSWPSGGGHNYIVQYRQTLDATDSWQTLTSAWPDSGTNITVFVHSNIVQNPTCGCGSGSGSGMMVSSMVTATAVPVQTGPLARPSDGSGDAVPLALYPPNFDLTGFLIYDPLTGETINGAGYTSQTLLPLMANLNTNDFHPMGGGSGGGLPPLPDGGPGGGGGASVGSPETGFYQVVQDGVQILNSSISVLINGFLSGTVNIGFETGNASNDGTGTNILGDLDCAYLIIDGNKYPGDGTLSFPMNGPRQFAMDTAYLENGTHTIQIQDTWLNSDNSNGNAVEIERQSDPVTITVSNVISYPNWEPEIGEAGISAYFLETTCTNADWHIDIYDVSNKLAQTLSGHTLDGTIEAYWNMVDTNGVSRTNADIDPEFSAIVTVADPQTAATPPKVQRKSNYPDHGHWVITYQDFFKFEYSENNYMQGSINAFANTAAKYGGYYLYYPPSGSTNDVGQTYPLRYQKANHFDATITSAAIARDQALLIYFLSNSTSRNFYYNGHGSPNTIAGGVSASTLQKAIKHRYRFVFLDGCDTDWGSLDAAFGIHGPKRYGLDYYERTGIRPGAFLGYALQTPYAVGGEVTYNGVTYDDTIPNDVPFFITNFLFYWDLMGQNLSSALANGQNNLNPVGGWYPGSGMGVFGYDGLKIDDVNHAGDTW